MRRKRASKRSGYAPFPHLTISRECTITGITLPYIASALRGIRGQLQSGHKENARGLFWYQVPPSVTPPGGLLGVAVCEKRAAPLFSGAYRTERRELKSIVPQNFKLRSVLLSQFNSARRGAALAASQRCASERFDFKRSGLCAAYTSLHSI